MPYRFRPCLPPARTAALRAALVVVLLAFGASATPASAHDPDDPGAPAPEVEYESVLDGYEPIEIVKKPDDWRAANDLAEELDGPRGQLLEPGAMPPKKKKP